jgi:uncharacterized protein (DUF1499 family)
MLDFTTNIKTRKPKLKLPSCTWILLLFLLALLTGCSGSKPGSIGQFIDCPDKPNCISSKSMISAHMLSPLKYKGTKVEAKEALLKVLESMPRTLVSTNTDNFLHVEFTSKIFQFVDDVEFYFDESEMIHFRSASRVGHSDMGVNRDRMNEISRLFFKTIQNNK